MLMPPTSLVILLLSCLTPLLAARHPICVGGVIEPIPVALATDCRAALRTMPLNRILYNGDNPPSFSLPPTARRPYPTIPHEFRSGNCVISVAKFRSSLHDNADDFPAPPVHAASAMYFNVWPALRRGAEEVIKTCFDRQLFNKWGTVHVSCEVEGTVWWFQVVVETGPEILKQERNWWQLVQKVEGLQLGKEVIKKVNRPALTPPLRRMRSS